MPSKDLTFAIIHDDRAPISRPELSGLQPCSIHVLTSAIRHRTPPPIFTGRGRLAFRRSRHTVRTDTLSNFARSSTVMSAGKSHVSCPHRARPFPRNADIGFDPFRFRLLGFVAEDVPIHI
jgi:hypothetical protein